MQVDIPPYAAMAYDAVWLYARAATEVLRRNQSLDNGAALIDVIRNNVYRSMSFSESRHTTIIDFVRSDKDPSTYIDTYIDSKSLWNGGRIPCPLDPFISWDIALKAVLDGGCTSNRNENFRVD